MSNASLSGSDWWRKNQARYPNSRDIGDLAPGFRSRVEDFVGSLREAGAAITVSSTRRSAQRAYLMHYSWKVGYGEMDAKDVPARSGVDIVWDHGDSGRSREAALEMVNLFNMAHRASLTSNHISGMAIDMNVSWKGELVMTRPSPLLWRLQGLPRTGQNRELHEVGGTIFGVRKLLKDPPHWSHDGR